MRVLVTGGNGFIGRHVVAEARRRGHHVRVLARTAGDPHKPLASTDAHEVVQHDLRQREGLTTAVNSMDAVIHCAASLTGDAATQQATTVAGTRNLIAAMREASVGHMVGLSTLALYDYQRLAAGSPLDEGSPLEENAGERNPYIGAKKQQEDMIRAEGLATGLRWTILRPGIVYGRDRTWFHHLGIQLSAKRWVALAPKSLLPLTYVENCAEAIVLALEAKAAHGETVNVIDDELPDRGTYMRELARRTTPRPSVSGIPWALLDHASSMTSGINRVLLGERAPLPDLLRPPSLHARCKPLQYPNVRARRALAWTPRWNFSQAIERTFGEAAPR